MFYFFLNWEKSMIFIKDDNIVNHIMEFLYVLLNVC